MLKQSTIKAPEFLDKTLFEYALQNGLHEQFVDVKEISFTSGSSDGENYFSQIFRVLISFDKTKEKPSDGEEISVIVKVMPSVEGFDFLNTMNAFNKEKWLLMEILLQFEMLLRSTDIQFAPRCYYAISNPRETLILQDMKPLGFEMANREIGLDIRHAKLAITKLAQFHAASMAFARKRPSTMDHYNRGLLDPNAMKPPTSIYKMIRKHLVYEIKLCSEWGGDFEQIAVKLQNFYDDFDNRLFACQESKSNEIKVLNHGDFWVNNLLFQYDERNNPVDVVFLDFQLSIYGSLGIDLNYFIFGSVQLEVLKKWRSLLEVYHVSLKNSLIDMGYDRIPKYADIEREFKQKSPYGFFTLVGPLPVMTIDKVLSEGASMETLAESDERTKAIFRSKGLIERLKYSLLEVDKLGALDMDV